MLPTGGVAYLKGGRLKFTSGSMAENSADQGGVFFVRDESSAAEATFVLCAMERNAASLMEMLV